MTTYYWVGGSGSLSSPNSSGVHLSLSSGGAPVGGAVAFTAATSHTLIVDSNSGSSGFAIAVSSPVPLGALDCSAAPTMNISGNAFLVYGDVVLSSSITMSTGFQFMGTVNQSIQSNGCAIRHSCSKNGSATLTLIDTIDLTNQGAWSTFGFDLRGGTVDTSGQACYLGWLKVNNAEFLISQDLIMVGALTGLGVAPKVRSASIGTPRTISAGSVSLANVAFRDIDAAGSAIPWTGTNLVDEGGNTNITF